MADKKNDGRTELFKRLTQLFRGGPSIKRKVRAFRTPVASSAAEVFKKSYSQVYSNALNAYGQYDRMSRYADFSEAEYTPEIACITGDMIINTPMGDFTALELLEKFPGDEIFPVYCFDETKQTLTIGNAHHVRKTKTAQIYKVSLDSGDAIRCTGDHLFLTRDSRWVEAQNLKCGDRLMPFYRKNSKQKQGYNSIYTISDGWRQEHQFVAEWMLGRSLEGYPNEVVHHKNLNKCDNSPDNLLVCSAEEHNAIHGREWSGYPTNERLKQIAEKISIANKGRKSPFKGVPGQKHTEEAKEKISITMTERHATDADYKSRATTGMIDFMKSDEGRAIACEKFTDMNRQKWDSDEEYQKKMIEIFSNRAKEAHKDENFKQKWRDGQKAYFASLSPKERSLMFNRSPENVARIESIIIETAKISSTYEKFIDLLDVGWTFKSKGTKCSYLRNYARRKGFKNGRELYNFYYQNHSVVSVELDGIEDVYDLTTDVYHNFACNGVIIHNSALDVYSEEASAADDQNNVLHVYSNNPKIQSILNELYHDILNVEFNITPWTRNLVKFGDLFLFIDVHPEQGVLNVMSMPVNEVEREEGWDPNDPFAVRFRWTTQGNKILESWQVAHFRLMGNDAFLPYGSSVLESARRIWRQLILIEDAMLVYRVVRSPERRVFYIDVGTVAAEEIPNYMEAAQTKLKRSPVIDKSSGRVDLRYNPLPVWSQSRIPLLDGRTITIQQLAEEFDEGKENWVYSVQDKTHKVVPGKVVWCGKNYTAERLVKVWLDDDTWVMTAPEHPFLMRDGTKKRADELAVGDSLMPLYRKLSSTDDGDYIDGYEKIYDPSVDDYVYTHRCIAKDGCLGLIPEGYAVSNEQQRRVVHHVDFDKRNNRPDNLVHMDYWEHRKYHSEHCNKTLNTPEQLAERSKQWTEMNHTHEHRQIVIETNKKHDKARRMGKIYNGSKLHSEHNAVRRDSQLESWATNKDARSAAMQCVIPDDCFMDVCLFVKQNKNASREMTTAWIRNNKKLMERMRNANSTNNRDLSKLHISVFMNYANKKGLAGKGWSAFKQYASMIQNHSVSFIELVDCHDDVYCMTVVGINGEDDRHNFAVVSNHDDIENEIVKNSNNGIYLGNSVDEDYFIPVRGSESGTKIDTLAGGQHVSDIADVEYIQKKLFAALKVPRAYLGYDESLSSKSTLAQEDIRFSRSIARIQRVLVSELQKIGIIHLFAHGFEGDDLADFSIHLSNPSTVAQMQKLELWRMKFEIAGTVPDGLTDRDFIRREIFKLTDEQIDSIKEGRIADRIEDMELEQAEVEGDGGGSGGGGGGAGGLGGLPGGGGGEPAFDSGGTDEEPEGGSSETSTGGGGDESGGEEDLFAGDVPDGQQLLTSADDDEDDAVGIESDAGDDDVSTHVEPRGPSLARALNDIGKATASRTGRKGPVGTTPLSKALYDRGRRRHHGASTTNMPDFRSSLVSPLVSGDDSPIDTRFFNANPFKMGENRSLGDIIEPARQHEKQRLSADVRSMIEMFRRSKQYQRSIHKNVMSQQTVMTEGEIDLMIEDDGILDITPPNDELIESLLVDEGISDEPKSDVILEGDEE